MRLAGADFVRGRADGYLDGFGVDITMQMLCHAFEQIDEALRAGIDDARRTQFFQLLGGVLQRCASSDRARVRTEPRKSCSPVAARRAVSAAKSVMTVSTVPSRGSERLSRA